MVRLPFGLGLFEPLELQPELAVLVEQKLLIGFGNLARFGD